MIFMIRESCLKFCIRASILNFLSCGARSALYPLAEVRGFTASTVKNRPEKVYFGQEQAEKRSCESKEVCV